MVKLTIKSNYAAIYEKKSQKHIAKREKGEYNKGRMEVKRYVVSIYCKKLQKYTRRSNL